MKVWYDGGLFTFNKILVLKEFEERILYLITIKRIVRLILFREFTRIWESNTVSFHFENIMHCLCEVWLR